MPPPLDSAGAAFCLRVLPLTALAQVSTQAETATRAPQAPCWLEKGPQPCRGERERDGVYLSGSENIEVHSYEERTPGF